MRTPLRDHTARIGLPVLATVLAAPCAAEPLAIDGRERHVVSIDVGRELHITLQTIGPGEYESPPSISSSSLRFLSVELVPPHVPAGPTQQFHFMGEAPGQAIVVFRHSEGNPTVTDTVYVR